MTALEIAMYAAIRVATPPHKLVCLERAGYDLLRDIICYRVTVTSTFGATSQAEDAFDPERHEVFGWDGRDVLCRVRQ